MGRPEIPALPGVARLRRLAVAPELPAPFLDRPGATALDGRGFNLGDSRCCPLGLEPLSGSPPAAREISFWPSPGLKRARPRPTDAPTLRDAPEYEQRRTFQRQGC